MGGEGHPVQSGHILALGTGGHNDNLVFGQALDVGNVHQGALLHLQIAQLLSDLQHIFHTPSGDGHLAAIALGGGDDSLNPVHIGGEGGYNDSLVTVFELTVQAFGNHILAGSVACALHIGGVGQHGKHPFVAQLTQPGQVDHPVGTGGIDLKVAGHYYGSHGGFDGEGNGVGDGVVYMDEFHGKAAGPHHIAGLVGNQLYGGIQIVFLQLQFNQAVGHGGAVNGTVDLLHAVGNGPDVIFVTVGDEHAPQLLLVCHQIGEVGNHQIHAVHPLIRETNAAVHDDHILAIFQNGDVLADFIQSAQGNNFQFFSQFA